MKLFSPVSPFHFSQAEIVKENSLKASAFGKCYCMALLSECMWCYYTWLGPLFSAILIYNCSRNETHKSNTLLMIWNVKTSALELRASSGRWIGTPVSRYQPLSLTGWPRLREERASPPPWGRSASRLHWREPIASSGPWRQLHS